MKTFKTPPSSSLLLASLALASCTAILAGISGCGGSGSDSTGGATGAATFKITWPEPSRLIPVASNSITVSFVTDRGGIVAQKTVARPTSGNTTILSFTKLPAGSFRLFARAFPTTDGNGTAQASAVNLIFVQAGRTVQAALTMGSTIATLAISPMTPSVAIGKTVTLVPTALDESGATVLVSPTTLSFTSSDPSVATITAGGTLTGIKAGTTTITLTEAESGRTVTATATIADTSGSAIVDLANAYISSLTAAQQSATVVPGTAANVAKWSNLAAVPSADGTNALRNGVAFSSLTSAQKTAFTNLAQTALGTQGYARLTQVRAAEDFLGTQKSGYSGDYVYVGFVGTPSTSGAWTLQIGGHNTASNLTYSGGTLASTTPYSIGVEPPSFTLNGTAFTPPQGKRDAAFDLLGSLTPSQLAVAKLGTSFSDVLLGSGRDARSNFPTGTSGRGVLGSTLTTAQLELLKKAIAAWTGDSTQAAAYQSLYEAQLAQTYVAYSGTAGVASAGDYVRIDGPNVWIEFAVQSGDALPSGTRYSSVWRDRVSDYNAAYGF